MYKKIGNAVSQFIIPMKISLSQMELSVHYNDKTKKVTFETKVYGIDGNVILLSSYIIHKDMIK